MKPVLVFVHGAFSTPNTFNYFRKEFADYPQMSFAYDWNDPPSQVGHTLATQVIATHPTSKIVLLGHSLGGNVIINALPHLQNRVDHVITYASPLGGSHHAVLVGLFSRLRVFTHIRPASSEIRLVKRLARQHSDLITSFVANRGPLSDRNDGVVTVASQRAARGLKYISVATNHMELLLSDNVVEKTRQIIEQ